MVTNEDFAEGLLSDEHVAKMLGVPPRTVRWWRLSGRLQFIKCGKHARIRRGDLRDFLDARTKGGEDLRILTP